jgi:hypothetical protein
VVQPPPAVAAVPPPPAALFLCIRPTNDSAPRIRVISREQVRWIRRGLPVRVTL